MIENTINDDKTIAWRKIGNLTTRIRCNSKHDENESKS